VNTVKEAIDSFMAAFAGLTEIESHADNFRAGMNRFAELTPNQQSTFHSKMQFLGNGYYQLWTLYKSGLLTDEESFQGVRNAFLTIIKTRGGRHWWAEWKQVPPERFIRDLQVLTDDPESGVAPLNEIFSWFTEEPPDTTIH
jgi:hypothetical protein